MHSALKDLICSTALLLTLPLSPALAAEEGDSSGAAMDQLLQEPEIGYYEMKPDFVTNLAGSAGGKLHYIRLSVSLMVADDRDLDLLKEKDPLLRDSIISTLGAKDYTSVATAEGREALRRECRQHLTELINEPAERTIIADVLFTNYIFQ